MYLMGNENSAEQSFSFAAKPFVLESKSRETHILVP